MDGTHTAGSKRFPDESGESPPHPKRLHAADRLLLDILEDVTDSGDRGPADPDAAGDLATVMRSFEEEIAALSTSQKCLEEQICDDDDLGPSDLGFLLEASDDDLGLPPTLPPSSDEGEVVDGDAGEGGRGGGDRGLEALGNLWAFDDEDRSCYEALGFGSFAEGDGAADDGVVVDGDLFGFSDGAPSSGASEFADLSWRPESLPTV